MDNERFDRIAELLEAALELEPEARAKFLDASCGGDQSVRVEVESLLGVHKHTHDFLETPAIQIDAAYFAGGEESGVWKPGEHVGEYEILSLLGEGGMGEVYLARDTTLNRQVALKLLKRGLNAGAVLRHFRHERQILASLNHPHIARLYGGAVTADGLPYLVMEYVEGERLDAYCDARRLGVTERLALFRKVCSAVAAAHTSLIIHRDLKPANIRVTSAGEPKLLDFGIAKWLDPDAAATGPGLTVTIETRMTPEYASPEQLNGESVTTATDVYSLGVVLYELLSGQRPYRFKSRQPWEMARVICEQEPERLSTAAGRTENPDKPGAAHAAEASPIRLRRRLAGDLDNIVAMAMRKEPAQRYGSVAQFSEDIRRHLDHLPVVARKGTLAYHSAKFVGRHQPAVAVAAFILLALIGGIVVVAGEAEAAKQAQARAEQLNEFLQKLLTSANPANMGRNVKVVEVLDAAGRQMDHELAAQPAILAQAHLTLGRAYFSLGLPQPAGTHLRAALALDRRIYGNNDPVTAQVMTVLGNCLSTYQDDDEAEHLLRQALVVQRRYVSTRKRELAATLTVLSEMDKDGEPQKDAESMLSEAMALTRQTDGPESEMCAMQWNAMGNLQRLRGDLADAEKSYRQAMEIERKLPVNRFLLVNPLTNLGTILLLQGRFDEAESLFREAQARARDTVGESAPTYGVIVGKLGYLDFMKGHYHQSAEELTRALQIAETGYSGSSDVVFGQALLGVALTRDGNGAAGEPHLRQALELKKKFPPDDPGLAVLPVDLESALGESLVAQKRYAEAEKPLIDGYETLRKRLGDKDPMTAAGRDLLRQLYAAWGKPEEARRFAGVAITLAKP